jgi:hypothetical protein
MTTTLQHQPGRHGDSDSQINATAFVTGLAGTPVTLQWDTNHHLQGHATCSGHPIVVIAARDASHTAVVMTRDDWNSVRRCDTLDRTQMLRECIIENHARFLQMLASN